MEQKINDSNLEERRNLIGTTIASPLASVISKYACHPIDTIKSKIQAKSTEMHSISQYRFGHSIQLIKQTWRSEGIKGFFRGVTLSAFGSVIAFSAYMNAYERTKISLKSFEIFEKYPFLNHLASGFSAELFSCIFWLPIDVIKERMQVQSVVKIYNYAGPRQAMIKIRRTEGIIGLYRAFGATLMFFGPTSAIFFVCYERLKELIVEQRSSTLMESIICSAGAGAISGFITTPLEMVKLRMQIQRADSAAKGISLENTLYGYRNIFHGIYLVYKKQGLLALYKGAGLRVMFTVPAFGISISLTDYFRNLAIASRVTDYFL